MRSWGFSNLWMLEVPYFGWKYLLMQNRKWKWKYLVLHDLVTCSREWVVPRILLTESFIPFPMLFASSLHKGLFSILCKWLGNPPIQSRTCQVCSRWCCFYCSWLCRRHTWGGNIYWPWTDFNGVENLTIWQCWHIMGSQADLSTEIYLRDDRLH